MQTDAIIKQLKAIVVQEFRSDLSAAEIGNDEPIMAEGLGLDSMGLITLIEHVETGFEIEFRDEDLRTATFETLATLANVIAERQGTEIAEQA